MDGECRTCGAARQRGLVCAFCGTPPRELSSTDDEAQALRDYHFALSNAADDVARKRLLQNGFIPSSTKVLIDAGLRMLPSLEEAVAESEAAGRLQAVISKLRITTTDKESERAANELERHLRRYQRSDRVAGYWVMGSLLAIIAMVGLWIASD